MPIEFDKVRSKIRDVLLADWDPTDAKRLESASGAYDVYVEPLHELIFRGATAEQVAAFLFEKEQEILCFPGLGAGRLMPVARKLLQMRDGWA